MKCKLALSTFMLLAGLTPLDASDRTKPEARPNIVIILADDYGYGSAGCYGADSRLVRTPNIDRLAREGRRFTDACTPSSVCSPTRYGVLTGRYCWRTPLKHEVLRMEDPLWIETNRLTVAALLQRHGYATAAIGKWHLGYGMVNPVNFTAQLRPGPQDIGFDYHFGLPTNHGDKTGVFVEGESIAGLRSARLTPTGKNFYDDKPFLGLDAPQRDDSNVMETLTDKAVAWIGQQKRDKPFFLYFTPVAVHEPITPSAHTKGSSQLGVYGDWIHDLDRSVGRILDSLPDNTLVIFTSDNGGENKKTREGVQAAAIEAGFKMNGQWRAGKHSVYEGGFRVPYLVRWPGKVPAGTVCDEMINLTDTFATIAALLGERSSAEDSFNVLPAWLAEKHDQPLRRDMILHSGDGVFAIRRGPWKYIEGKSSKPNPPRSRQVEFKPQLYNLAADPAETKNVIAGHPDIAKELAALIERYRDGGYSREVPQAKAKPNILLILSDDMGFSDLGCYGSEIQTPNLDSLAAGGLRFTQFYNAARCCPTRASLLTGLYPHQAGMGHMTTDRGLDGFVGDLNNHCVTIAQVLKRAGYATFAVGKWHVARHIGPNGQKHNWPLQRGFDRYYGTIQGAGSFYDPASLTRGNTQISPVTDPEYKPEEYYYTTAITDHAIRYVAEHHQKNPQQPFFMYVAYTAAHWPMQAPEKDIAKYRGKYDQGYEPIRKARFEREMAMGLIDPKWLLSPQWGEWDTVKHKQWEARCMEVYAAMIDCMDQGIGRIVASLRSSGQLDNTLILFLQDNGGNYEAIGRNARTPPLTDHFPGRGPDFLEQAVIPKQTRDGLPVRQGPGVMPGPRDTYISYGQGWANVCNVPFREYKHFVHEGGIATPLIAYWPAGILRKNQLEKQPGHVIDLMATCVDISGATYPRVWNGRPITPMEGRSLLPAFSNEPIQRDALYWEHEGNRAVRVGNWKLVAKAPSSPNTFSAHLAGTGAWELYDMELDRTETHDLAAKLPDKVKELREKWDAYATRTHVLPWPWQPPYAAHSPSAGTAGEPLTLQPQSTDDRSGNKATTSNDRN